MTLDEAATKYLNGLKFMSRLSEAKRFYALVTCPHCGVYLKSLAYLRVHGVEEDVADECFVSYVMRS